MLKSLAKVAHSDLKFAKVGVNLRCHDMARAENLETAIDRALEQKVSVFHILLRDVQIGQDIVNGNLHRMIVAPVVVEYSECLAEVDVGIFSISIHEMSLDEDAIELDCLSMQGTQSLTESVKSHISLLNGLVPHLLVKSNLAHCKQSLNIICLLRVLRKSSLHMTRFYGLLDTLFAHVLICFL